VALNDEMPSLIGFLSKRFNASGVRLVPDAKNADQADIYIGDERIAPLLRDEEDGEISYQVEMVIGGNGAGSAIKPGASLKEDLESLTDFLRKRFGAETLRVVIHPKKTDMAEIFIEDEFIAPLYRDEQKGGALYQVQLVILDVDLDEA